MKRHPKILNYLSIVKHFGFTYPIKDNKVREQLDDCIKAEYELIKHGKSSLSANKRKVIIEIVETVDNSKQEI